MVGAASSSPNPAGAPSAPNFRSEELAPGLSPRHDVAYVMVNLVLGAVGSDGGGGEQQSQPGWSAQRPELQIGRAGTRPFAPSRCRVRNGQSGPGCRG